MEEMIVMATDEQKKYTEELYKKITPYLVGAQATQETIDKAHSIYDVEKERQAKRDAEKEKAKSDAGAYIASKNPSMFHPGSPTPSSQIVNEDMRGKMHPGGPVYIKEEPKGLNRISSADPTTSEVKTEAAWLSDYVNNYLKKPITPEEEARRERAARAVQGVAGLGNVITAFSNLAFTGKGAPSQTLPTQQADAMGKEITSWQDKLASEREKYAAAQLGAKTQQWKMEQEAQQRAQMQANEDRRFEYQKGKDEQTRQDKLTENAQAQENWNKQHEQSLKQQDIVNKQNQQRLSISQQQADTAEKRADAYANYQNWRVNGGGSSQNWAKPIEIKDAEGNNRVAYINQKAINDSNLQQIVSTLPEELREKHGLKGDWSDATVLGAFDEKVSRAIGEAAKDMSSETFRLMERLGLISVEDKDGASVDDNNLPPSKRTENNNNLPPSKRNQ